MTLLKTVRQKFKEVFTKKEINLTTSKTIITTQPLIWQQINEPEKKVKSRKCRKSPQAKRKIKNRIQKRSRLINRT